ncbi:MAG: hypothetical protein COT24_03885 [Candidatus Kerfeldbacteria bacterium CG08_land_8_20_14_0_20_40_16]|uniref:Asl1-like glycosyl hydrolase catalytic domain-containing protein n=1 Tax=Candidatus Kerfeldbacteria bacterium CG08_land_8_20_14_0_20_40_16 TaxID=2014244 RepID=A0A2H0YV16_9BACT|nr:MAG: hypothetical protein COT24_03885 [Candidatus Kerfeldbacteria bacterium CG08_land_8_20_14_0_20_40_16]
MRKAFIFIIILVFFFYPLVGFAESSTWAVTNDKVGLNVHWALGGFGKDSQYSYRLTQSRTKWVREHFYTEVFMVENPNAWFERYDYVLNEYHRKGIKVLGMLAYGPEHGDFQQPNLELWEDYVRTIVYRYKNRVAAWEIWNEPDSPSYLNPNNPETFGPILETAYRTIKNIDPGALVLNGGLVWPNFYFAEQLFQNYNQYFDRLAVHAYYCREGNNQLLTDLNSLQAVVNKYRPGEKIWITELGCSSFDESFQESYLAGTAQAVLEAGFVEKIFLYNIRNRETGNAYEDHFGLLTLDLRPRLSWNWYRKLPRGPYDQPRISVELEQKHAQELRAVLENYFGLGKIPVSAENWSKLVNAYIYGGYPVIAIVQSLRFGGKTVHPTIHYDYWQESIDYQNYINKDLINGRFVYSYGKARLPIDQEQQKALELKQKLQDQFGLEHLRINDTNWVKLLNAYAYGGYPVEAIARAVIYGGKTVHLEIPWKTWQESADYQEFISKPIPTS